MLKNYLTIPFFFLVILFHSFFAFSQDNLLHDAHSQMQEHEVPEQASQSEVTEYPDYADFNDYFLHDQTHTQTIKETDNFQAKFLNMLFILALLIGFMILASWLLKRMMKSRITQINQASSIKVLETRQLSPKSMLYLIEVEGEMLLIGESPTAINHIATFPAAVETTIPPFPKAN